MYRSKSEGVDIHTIETIDIEHEVGVPKVGKKRGRRPKIKEEPLDVPVSNEEIVENEVEKNIEKRKCSSVENLIEMLEDDDIEKDNDESTTNDIEEDCSQKLIGPADIKQEAIHHDLENIDEDELDESGMLDEEESEYDCNEENDDTKNDDETSSSKKPKITKNSLKKKAPEILIPQMVSDKYIYIYVNILIYVIY